MLRSPRFPVSSHSPKPSFSRNVLEDGVYTAYILAYILQDFRGKNVHKAPSTRESSSLMDCRDCCYINYIVKLRSKNSLTSHCENLPVFVGPCHFTEGSTINAIENVCGLLLVICMIR